jgi:hypothetical protein
MKYGNSHNLWLSEPSCSSGEVMEALKTKQCSGITLTGDAWTADYCSCSNSLTIASMFICFSLFDFTSKASSAAATTHIPQGVLRFVP